MWSINNEATDYKLLDIVAHEIGNHQIRSARRRRRKRKKTTQILMPSKRENQKSSMVE